jgi:hypothetical protein
MEGFSFVTPVTGVTKQTDLVLERKVVVVVVVVVMMMMI